MTCLPHPELHFVQLGLVVEHVRRKRPRHLCVAHDERTIVSREEGRGGRVAPDVDAIQHVGARVPHRAVLEPQ